MIIKKEILNELIKAFKFNECQEATTIQNEPDVAYEVDLKKKGDIITIVLERKQLENKEKKEFERWLDSIDDDMFQEALERVEKITGLNPKELNAEYDSEDFKNVISHFKKIIPTIAKERINNLTKYLNVL